MILYGSSEEGCRVPYPYSYTALIKEQFWPGLSKQINPQYSIKQWQITVHIFQRLLYYILIYSMKWDICNKLSNFSVNELLQSY